MFADLIPALVEGAPPVPSLAVEEDPPAVGPHGPVDGPEGRPGHQQPAGEGEAQLAAGLAMLTDGLRASLRVQYRVGQCPRKHGHISCRM